MLTVQKEAVGPVDVIEVKGRVDGSTAPQLDDALQESLKKGRYRIVVDFSETSFLSSAGMRALLRARQQVQDRRRHGDVRLAKMSPFIQDAFKLVGFDKLFKIYEDREAALNSF